MSWKLACKRALAMILAGALATTSIAITPIKTNAAAGDTKTVTLNQTNTKIEYDGGNAYTMLKKVTYKKGGKSITTKAFCLQPADKVPKDGKYTAIEYAGTNDLARCLYYADGAPGESAFRSFMKQHSYTKYIDNGNQYYAFMHILAAYAYKDRSSTAFNIYDSSKKLSSSYQSAIKNAYKFCTENLASSKQLSFSVKSTENNKSSVSIVVNPNNPQDTYTTPDFEVKGNTSFQKFSLNVPVGYTLNLKNPGAKTYTEYGEGKTATVKVGALFNFVIKAEKATGEKTFNPKGAYGNQTAYKINVAKDEQNLGFFTTEDDVTAAFKIVFSPKKIDPPEPEDPKPIPPGEDPEPTPVHVPKGRIMIKKATRSISGTVSPEMGAVFRIYNTSFSSYSDAAANNSSGAKYAATVATGSDGTGISPDMHADPSSAEGNTYRVEQISGTEGHKLASSRIVTVNDGDTTPVSDSGENYIINQQCALKIKINKIDEATGSLITDGSATFGIYTEYDCENLVDTVTTTNGVGTSIHLNHSNTRTYYIKELSAPDGYDVNPKPQKVNVSYSTASYSSGDSTYYVTANIKDSKTTYHDIVVKKTAEGGDWEAALSGDTTAFEKLKNEEFTFKATFNGLNPSTEYTYTDGTFTSNSDGDATVTFKVSLARGSDGTFNSVTFKDIPSKATYKIEEVGQDYLGGNVGYTASYTITANKESAKVPMKTGKPGEGISTETERFPGNTTIGIADENYPVEYTFNNSAKIRHNIILKKALAGEDADVTDRFTFNVQLSGLASNGSKYDVPGYTVYTLNEDGEKVVVALEERTTSTSSSHTYTILMKANYILELSQIDTGTNYTITEEGSDYTASYKKYVYAAGSSAGAASETKEGIPNDGITASGTMAASDAALNVEYNFVNTLRKEEVPNVNKLIVEKFTNNGNDTDEFIFEVKLSNLDPGTTYAVVGKGTDTYRLKATNYVLSCETTDGSKKAGGMTVDITRSDGKTKHLATNSSGTLDLSGYVKWAKQKGGDTLVIGWEGGSIDATVTSSGVEYSTDEMNGALLANCSIGNFTTGASATTATQTINLRSSERVTFMRLPEKAMYVVTEQANTYTPTYSIRRDNLLTGKNYSLNSNKNDKGSSLATDSMIFPEGSSFEDTVTFVNKKDVYDLDIDKTTSDGIQTKSFTFDVDLSNLSEENYFAVIPGEGVYDVTVTTGGDITILQTSGPATDFTGMPLTIKRPDGDTMTVTADASGVVPADSYVEWLVEGRTGTVIFTVSFLGQEIRMSCVV